MFTDSDVSKLGEVRTTVAHSAVLLLEKKTLIEQNPHFPQQLLYCRQLKNELVIDSRCGNPPERGN